MLVLHTAPKTEPRVGGHPGLRLSLAPPFQMSLSFQVWRHDAILSCHQAIDFQAYFELKTFPTGRCRVVET